MASTGWQKNFYNPGSEQSIKVTYLFNNNMINTYNYSTVASAITSLRQNGFSNDFKLFEDHIGCGKTVLNADDLKIKVIYRYEGDSDPADEATVYGMESKSGLKGILVLGDEMNSDVASIDILKKLHLKILNPKS
jgi:hypothetical protein